MRLSETLRRLGVPEERYPIAEAPAELPEPADRQAASASQPRLARLVEPAAEEPEYKAMYLAGRCANGCEADGGTLLHAVPTRPGCRSRALCGAQPGRRSVGWNEYDQPRPVTCPRCLKRLARLQAKEEKAPAV